MQEKEIEKKLVYEGKLFQVWHAKVQLDTGEFAEREYLEHITGSVAAIVLDEQKNVYLVREYRTAAHEIQVHIPGGTFIPSEESPEAAIEREVREEIGIRPRQIEKLFESHGGGSWFWPQHFFLCTDLLEDPLPGDWDERIEIVRMSFKDYLQKSFENTDSRFGDFKAAILVAKKLGLLDIRTK